MTCINSSYSRKKKQLIQLLVMLIPYEKNTEVSDNE